MNKILPPKWFTKVKIIVSHDYHFTVIAMIDSSTDMNCILEGLIPSKYFEKSTERLVSANGTQMKIKYELNNAHFCHAKVKHLNFLKQEVRYKKIAKQLSDKLLQSKINNFQKMLIDDVCSNVPKLNFAKQKSMICWRKN